MSEHVHFERQTLFLNVQGVDLEIAVITRPGPLAPIFFMHGIGSTKEDYADLVFQPAFAGRRFVAYDAPGCGESKCPDSRVNIHFQVATALAVLEALDIERFHLVGHSMGGLGALVLADQQPGRVLSFTDIEGNVAPEDCFLSRQIVTYRDADPQRFFKHFVERTHATPAFASALYAASLAQKVRPGAVPGIFESMVELSDNGDLMSKFLGLPCPKMFMYGEQNNTLSYLRHIESRGVRLAEIPHCGHFPMYSNPPVMWREIAAFLAESGQ